MQDRRSFPQRPSQGYNPAIADSTKAITEAELPAEETQSDPEPLSAATVDQRVMAILDSAEREAERIREQARHDAHAYVEQVRERADRLAAERIAELSRRAESIETYVSRVQDQSAEMVETLDRAVTDSHRDSAARLPAGDARKPEWAGLGVEVALAGIGPSVPEGSEPPTDQRMVDATRMALSGKGREEIGRMLTEVHGMADPEPILRTVLGP